MRNPLDKAYRVTSPYGMRTLGSIKQMHTGIDLVPADGIHPTKLFATVDGVVSDIRKTVPDSHTGLNVTTMVTGNYVNIKTKEGFTVIYRHLKANSSPLENGQTVKINDLVGVMGSTGQSTGTHLHYEIRNELNNAVDPAIYLANDKTFTPESEQNDSEENNSSESGDIKVGNKVRLKRAVQYNGEPFKAYYDIYDVIQATGDRVVIGIGKTVTAAVNAKDLIIVSDKNFTLSIVK